METSEGYRDGWQAYDAGWSAVPPPAETKGYRMQWLDGYYAARIDARIGTILERYEKRDRCPLLPDRPGE